MATSPARREKLLEAARREFGRHGFAGARVARIAQAAGVNKQLIFYYFGSKDGLRRAVEREASTVPSLPDGDASTPATERLRDAIRTVFQAFDGRPELVRALVQPPGVAGEGDGPEHAVAHFEGEIARLVSEGQGLGYFRDDADPGTIGRQALVLCVGYLALEPRLPAADRERWVGDAGKLLVRMLAW